MLRHVGEEWCQNWFEILTCYVQKRFVIDQKSVVILRINDIKLFKIICKHIYYWKKDLIKVKLCQIVTYRRCTRTLMYTLSLKA